MHLEAYVMAAQVPTSQLLSVGWDHLRGFIANHARATKQGLELIDHALNPL